MDGEEPTQATQNVLDPRREGKQNSGFSDDDISDIICVLYPHSETARRDVQLLVAADSPLIIGKDEVDSVEPDYDLEDHASRFESSPFGHGNHAIILRLSSGAKNPKQGFAFGRNKARCDVVFDHDPLRRVSNVHFRIYVNEFGIVMLEDQSTNGTWVDRELLTAHPKDGGTPTTRWALSSGSLVRIYLHHKSRDLTFRVRIPRREAEYEKAYHQKVEEFFIRHGLPFQQPAAPVGQPGTGGHVDVFRQPAQPLQRQPGGDGAPGQQNTTQQVPVGSRTPRRRDRVIRNEWTGSGKYNRVGTIGKGAFAVVYKVTAKYDGKPYAAKELDRRRFMKNGVLDQKVETEMKIMQRVQHPNIVRYIENFDWDERLLIIIMEYIGGGDLGKAILDDGPMTEDMVQVMSQQLLSALGYLHLNNITHRDVKPDNILISSLEPLDVKLTDFGLSKMVDNEQTFLRTFCGTLLYCAPEVYTEYTEYDDNGFRYRGQKARRMPGQRYNHAIDIWSLGGVIFFTLTGSPPYPVKTGISHSELLHKIMTTRLDVSPLQDVCVSERGIDFLSRMLQRRPENRATITELDSHSWLGGPGSIIDASQSYDVITDDEDDTAGYREEMDVNEDDRVDDSGDDMDKENQQAQQPGRLFGEIPGSAIGSSGAIPEDFVARRNDFSMGETEILGQENGSIQERTATHHIASYAQNQSADELQSLVEKAASQSLGGDDLPQNGFSVSNYSDFNTSKRKPPSTDTSGEWDGSTSTAKPFYKRLKSEGNIDEISDATMEECKLLLSVPPISRSPSGRQINGPVDKIVFWEQDHKTWHLQYPEMTQLQLDAFIQAASTRGEEFKPGKTPLWDLAMRHFPPGLSSPEPEVQRLSPTPQPGLRRDDTRLVGDSMADFPPTAPPVDTPSSDMATPDTQIVVPVQMDAASTRPVGVVESHPNSCISDISFAITDSLVSFGRGPDNSKPFQPRTEPRVPKNAFKILLWKEGYDPSRSPKKTPHPWLREESELDDDGSSYSFWISTKATIGIKINGLHLASSDPKNPSSPSRHWTRLHNNDNLLLWGAHDASREQTTVVFRCFWGASSQPRQDVHRLTLADAETAAKLDAACAKTEGRIRNAARKIRMEDAAKSEYLERQKNVDRERQRSNVFETRRVEAMQFVGRQSQFNSSLLSGFTGPSSRRGSPASAPPPASRLHGLE